MVAGGKLQYVSKILRALCVFLFFVAYEKGRFTRLPLAFAYSLDGELLFVSTAVDGIVPTWFAIQVSRRRITREVDAAAAVDCR